MEEFSTSGRSMSISEDVPVPQVIVACFPSDDKYYQDMLPAILDYLKELDVKTVEGEDELVILHQGSSMLTETKFQHARLLKTKASLDLWIRDYATIVPEQQVLFKYQPQYLKQAEAQAIQQRFSYFLSDIGVGVESTSKLVLDGGNIVDNGYDKAIISARIEKDNPGKTREEMGAELGKLLNREICFIPEPRDKTGHSDGVVTFIEEDVCLVGDYGKGEDKIAKVVQKMFPYTTVCLIPCFEKGGKWRDFDSAEGCYVNCLVTSNCVYVPFFDDPQDQTNMALMRSWTKKKVVSVNCAGVAKMGGNVRCMTWQIDRDHVIAQRLLERSQPSQ